MLIFDKIECCGKETKGRVYYIDERRYLIFIDKCPNCSQAIAEIRHKKRNGELCVNIRRKGEAAIRLLNKHNSHKIPKWTIPIGTKDREYSFINKFGIIFNENGIKIAPQKDFLSMNREEINAILNKRFPIFHN